MSMKLSSDDLRGAAYDFGNTAAPVGFDPDSAGYDTLPPGWHLCRVSSFQIVPESEFKYKEILWTANQLRPLLTAIEGPCKGASVIDFLPMPTPGAGQMPKEFANQWGNFMRSIGFPLPPTSLVPSGFTLDHLTDSSKPVWVKVVPNTQNPTKPNKVDYYGYRPQSEPPASVGGSTPQAAKASNGGQKNAAAAPSESKSSSLDQL